MIKKVFFIFFCFLFSGCRTISSPPSQSLKNSGESYREVDASLRSVAEGVAGKELNEKEYKQLKNDLKKNPETQSAVQSVTDALTKEAVIKYCPHCGKRYSASFEVCPEDHTPLKILK